MVDAPAPLWINKDATSGLPVCDAQALRLADAVLIGNGSPRPLGARSGIRPGTGEVTVSGSTVTVQPVAYEIDAAVSTTQGPYRGAEPEVTTFTLAAADSTNPRKDIVYVRVSDTDADASGARKAEVLYAAGIPAQTPTAPTLPSRSLLIATVDVPKLNGGAASVTQANQYAVASGGILPVSSQAEADALTGTPGMHIRRLDTGALEWFDAAGQRHGDDTGWVALPPATGSWASGTGTSAPVVRRRSGQVTVTGRWSRQDSNWSAGQATPIAPAQLDPDFRPSVSVFGLATAGAGFCQMEIAPDGWIYLSYPSVNTVPGSRVWLSATWPR